MRSLLVTVILVLGFSLSSLHVYLAIPFWLEEFLLKDQLLSLWESPCALFVAFNNCSLCLIFVSLINMCLGVFHLGCILFGTLSVYWTWVAISFPIFEKFFIIISSSIFLCPFFLSSFSSGTPMFQMVGRLKLSQRSVRLSSFLLFFFSSLLYFHHSISHLTYLFFCLSYSTVGSLQSVFNLSYFTVHYWLSLLYFF